MTFDRCIIKPTARAELERVLAPSKPQPVDLIDVDLLRAACPGASAAELEKWVSPIKAACKRWEIESVREVAAFLSQAGHESMNFRRLEENLNYSAPRLRQVWPRRFPTAAVAEAYARNPEKLANNVYANRMGNGPPESGDGWRFRGAGLFQLTGRSNHTRCAEALGIPLKNFPDYLRSPVGAAMSAGWFFFDNDLHRLANTPGVEDETRRINGGLHGVEDRRDRFNAVVALLLERGA